MKDSLGRPVVVVTGMGIVTSLGQGKADKSIKWLGAYNFQQKKRVLSCKTDKHDPKVLPAYDRSSSSKEKATRKEKAGSRSTPEQTPKTTRACG